MLGSRLCLHWGVKSIPDQGSQVVTQVPAPHPLDISPGPKCTRHLGLPLSYRRGGQTLLSQPDPCFPLLHSNCWVLFLYLDHKYIEGRVSA